MRRRDFVAAGVAAAAGHVTFRDLAWAQTTTPRFDRLIDAHCHIFNADDVPIEGFANKIILPHAARNNQLVARFREYPGALRALVRAVTLQVKAGAPNHDVEIRKIIEFERDPGRKPTRAARQRDDIKNIEGTLRIIWGKNRDLFKNLSLGNILAIEVAIENLQLFLIHQFHPLFGKPTLSSDERQELAQWPLNSLAQKLYTLNNFVGHYIRWALLFTRYRFELAEELQQLQGRAGQKPRIVLLTPAAVDLGKWLEDDNHTSIERQVDVMRVLARRKTGSRVHAFVGFDPLRQALHESGIREPRAKEPLEIVRDAIEVRPLGANSSARTTGGLIGVKLYPPMGFRAANNSALDDSKFMEPAYLRSADKGLGGQIGMKLDAALTKLYAWCSDNNVPIMAHVNNTFGPNRQYEDRAHPDHWNEVLSDFPRLRINMAHFGHFEEAVAKPEPRLHLRETWEWTIGEILASSHDSYAYADISSLSELLETDQTKKILECMIAFRQEFPAATEKLIYGSDWSMIAQSESFPKVNSTKSYPDLMIQFLKAVGYTDPQIEGIMFRNAARFLGLSTSERALHKDNCTRARLEQFYSAHQLPTAWMAEFD